MTKKLYFRISGLDCADEVAVLKREVGPLVGGEENLSFDILKGRMGVLDGDAQQVMEAVARTGMKAELWREDGEPAPPPRFVPYLTRTEPALLSVKVPRKIARRAGWSVIVVNVQAPPTMP